jgi:hypothetical protein
MLFPRFAFKMIAYLSAVVVFALCITALVMEQELRLIREFDALKQLDPLVKARELVEAGEYCEALDYLEYFMDYDYVKQNPEVTAFYNEVKKTRQSYAFIGRDVAEGVFKGKGACPESLVSATVSDFLIIGDIRDLFKGLLNKYYYGASADEFTMALAGVGMLASGITYAAGGASSPAKVSISLLKAAKKMGKLPQPLEKSLIGLFKQSAQARDLRALRPATDSLYAISQTNGLRMRDLFTVLSRSRSVGDLKTMEKVVGVYGAKTGKFLKLGGDAPVSVLKRFPKDPHAVTAVDTALKYGVDGGRLLEKTGPTKFLKYVTLTKYAARTTRSIWEKRLTTLLVKFVTLFPPLVIVAMWAASGLVVVGAPAYFLVARIRHKRRKTPE